MTALGIDLYTSNMKFSGLQKRRRLVEDGGPENRRRRKLLGGYTEGTQCILAADGTAKDFVPKTGATEDDMWDGWEKTEMDKWNALLPQASAAGSWAGIQCPSCECVGHPVTAYKKSGADDMYSHHFCVYRKGKFTPAG